MATLDEIKAQGNQATPLLINNMQPLVIKLTAEQSKQLFDGTEIYIPEIDISSGVPTNIALFIDDSAEDVEMYQETLCNLQNKLYIVSINDTILANADYVALVGYEKTANKIEKLKFINVSLSLDMADLVNLKYAVTIFFNTFTNN